MSETRRPVVQGLSFLSRTKGGSQALGFLAGKFPWRGQTWMQMPWATVGRWKLGFDCDLLWMSGQDIWVLTESRCSWGPLRLYVKK